MSSEDRNLAAVLLTVCTVVVAVGLALDARACDRAWADSGRPSVYGAFSGCRVELPDGRWVPADTIRFAPGAVTIEDIRDRALLP